MHAWYRRDAGSCWPAARRSERQRAWLEPTNLALQRVGNEAWDRHATRAGAGLG